MRGNPGGMKMKNTRNSSKDEGPHHECSLDFTQQPDTSSYQAYVQRQGKLFCLQGMFFWGSWAHYAMWWKPRKWCCQMLIITAPRRFFRLQLDTHAVDRSVQGGGGGGGGGAFFNIFCCFWCFCGIQLVVKHSCENDFLFYLVHGFLEMLILHSQFSNLNHRKNTTAQQHVLGTKILDFFP